MSKSEKKSVEESVSWFLAKWQIRNDVLWETESLEEDIVNFIHQQVKQETKELVEALEPFAQNWEILDKTNKLVSMEMGFFANAYRVLASFRERNGQ
jgi:hypothetical protein